MKAYIELDDDDNDNYWYMCIYLYRMYKKNVSYMVQYCKQTFKICDNPTNLSRQLICGKCI
jgi:hypothetical protein